MCNTSRSSSFTVQPLALVIGLVLLGGLASTTLAQTPGVIEQNQLLDFDLPAGPLSERLLHISRTAGVVITVDAALVNGKTAAPVRGRMSAEQALQHALIGSGLELVQGAAGYTLRPVRDAGVLPAVRVNASSLAATTESSGSYTTGAMSTATKLPLSIRETPQSVTVITRDRMDDQGLITATDLLRNTPGITSTATAPYRETFYSRGFAVETYLFDGMPVAANSSRRGTFLNDMAMYDRVEVVRGSSGLTQGSGTPSAAINFVRKRPTAEFQSYVQGQAGRWNYRGVEGDVSGPLSKTGALRGRAVVHWHDSDSFMDVVTEKRQLVYLIGEVDVIDNTLFTISLSHQENDNNTTYGGLPTALDGSDLKLPRSSYFGNTWNFWDDDTTALFTSLEHRFANGWKANFSINQIWGDQEQMRAGIGWNATQGQWDQSGGWATLKNDRTSFDVYATGPLTLFGREHELVVGASSRTAKEANDTAGYWPGYVFATNIDIYDWHHNAPKPEFEVDYYFNSTEEQYGAYATLRWNLADSLKFITGVRFDWFDFTSSQDIWGWDSATQARTGWTNRISTYDYEQHPTKYAGLVYDLGKQYSLYISYSDIFKPQNARDKNENFIKPIVGENYEAGIKGEYFDGALNINASVFRIDEANRAQSIGQCLLPEKTIVCNEPLGVTRSEGYDLEIQGALTDNWQIGGGYTHVETEIEEDVNPVRVGTILNTQLPNDQFKLSTSYRFPSGKWRIGSSLRWQDGIYHQGSGTGYSYRTEQDAYTIVDAMLGYKHSEHLDVQLNINNLFDEVYYSAINAQPVIWGGNSVYGEPRKFMLTARYKF